MRILLEVTYVCSDRLPVLGWCLAVDFHDEVMSLWYGKGVERRAGRIVEGVWDAPFELFEPQKSVNLFGSCVDISEDHLLLCASTATSEPLFFMQQHRVTYASNSQALLLAACNARLVAGETRYEAINDTRYKGLEHVVIENPTSAGALNRLVHHNLILERNGYRIQEKATPAPFVDYCDYVAYLKGVLQGCIKNAKSTSRKHPLQLITTQSRGYDSTAINALLGDYRPDRAFTCPKAKPIGQYYRGPRSSQGPSDDGSKIASALGFSCEQIERHAFHQDNSLELYFNAAIHSNQDRNLQPIFEKVDQPSMLLTGMMGEMWYTRQAMIDAQYIDDADNMLKRADISGFGMSEVRLHRSLVHCPVPYIGAVQRESVHKITESEEMAPWRLNCSYDRPIARRIAEDAGVPREFFGQKKMGAVVMMGEPELPMDKKRRREFKRDLVKRGLLDGWQLPLFSIVHRYNNWLLWQNPNRYFSNSTKYPFAYYCSRAVEKLTGKKPRFKPIWERLNAELYRYSCNELADSYQWLAKELFISRCSEQPDVSVSVTDTANENTA